MFFQGEKPCENQQTTQHDETTECKSIKRVRKNGRIISYIMSPVPKLEPALPRRKKHPDLAYRHHEFLISDGTTHDGPGTSNLERARVKLHEYF